MRGAKPCPACGFLLRYEDPPDASFDALRFVGVQLLPWACLALFLAWRWAPAGENEIFGILALAVLALWFRLRPRAREQGEALLARRRYRCAGCGRRYTGADLTSGDA
ncbi:MAG TPA: hypothetical protein VFV84_04895 [Burkholderiales bacterium]|nr:hypothetical protein [Burkholderiales bacterium]